MLGGEGEEVVVIGIATVRDDLGRVAYITAAGQRIAQEALAVLLADDTDDLRPSHHRCDLADERRAEQVLEAPLDARHHDPAGDAAGRDGRGHEHARVQDDEHYEALRRSARAARSSS